MWTAVLFDFDGVIVNTEPLHYAALSDTLSADGLSFSWDDYLKYYIGFDDRDAIRERFKRAGQSIDASGLADRIRRKADAFEALVRREKPAPYPGVCELIREISGGLPTGLCSGALLRDIEPVLRYLGLSRAFHTLVTADDVAVSKPDPACYHLAVERLSAYAGRAISAKSVLAIEDTPAGIRAARAAGLEVLGLAHSYDRDCLDEATFSLETISGLDLAGLWKIRESLPCRTS